VVTFGPAEHAARFQMAASHSPSCHMPAIRTARNNSPMTPQLHGHALGQAQPGRQLGKVSGVVAVGKADR
jgi:hypothetical protein